ncbi:hypothetical protein ES319_A03G121100v1 [Gossypium barbadense]|uniref:Uncharacterized protein n=2 Tax=Gossypium barbadense TaxID=3634 RepID=A0A5J5WCG2_GOSBA|nr:hypothetical protein ES319_A03G121100v1 [Gossypium barbadense]KAB2090402.1 hypothetical protein ES319_A03G121100v1 [Gossypium barbadense]
MHSFFVDVNLFKANKERAAGIAKSNNDIVGHVNNGSSTSTKDGLANEDANLMIKMKFLTYKLRTFLIRNGLSILFKDGPAAYRAYYLRQMKIWGTLVGKQRELSKILNLTSFGGARLIYLLSRYIKDSLTHTKPDSFLLFL